MSENPASYMHNSHEALAIRQLYLCSEFCVHGIRCQEVQHLKWYLLKYKVCNYVGFLQIGSHACMWTYVYTHIIFPYTGIIH